MRLFSAIIILLLATNSVFCQNNDEETQYKLALDSMDFKPKFGIYADWLINYNSMDLRTLPGVPGCCPKYTDGSGKGLSFGALFEYPVVDKWSLGAALGYSDYHSLIERDELQNILINGKSQTGTVRHSVDADFSSIDISPYVLYNAYNKLNIKAGFGFSFITKADYYQIEKIVNPSNQGTFQNGLSYQNESEGNISDLNSLQFGIKFGISYQLPLNLISSLCICPEASYEYRFTDIVKSNKWNTSLLKAGIALKYVNPPAPPPPPAAPLSPPLPLLALPAIPPLLTADLKAVELDSNQTPNASFSIKLEDFTSLNMRPLLNFIFFDENSSVLPKRYIVKTKDESESFSLSELKSLDAINTYYNVLNIVGMRMIENPKAKIKLVGCNSDESLEKNNKDLSMNRALSVRNYLRDIWGIENSRMQITARNLPDEPTNSDDFGTNEENRRVEIIPSDKTLFEPVITGDTLRRLSTLKIRFLPEIKSEAGIKDWKITATQNDNIIKTFEGNASITENLDWSLNDDDKSSPHNPGAVLYNIEVNDVLGQKFVSDKKKIPVEQLTIDRKRLERRMDKEFETYSLILFDYGSSNLASEHRKVVDLVKSRLSKDAKVYITGYTDSMGEEEVNKRISELRARAVSNRLKIENAVVRGAGESVLMYDNLLPEGRFYCRTVVITIETQVSE